MNADAAAQTTMAARSAGAPRPLRASPRASTEKMIMAASSARAWTWAARCSCFWEKTNAYCAAYTTYSSPASSRPEQRHAGVHQAPARLTAPAGRAALPAADRFVRRGPLSRSYWYHAPAQAPATPGGSVRGVLLVALSAVQLVLTGSAVLSSVGRGPGAPARLLRSGPRRELPAGQEASAAAASGCGQRDTARKWRCQVGPASGSACGQGAAGRQGGLLPRAVHASADRVLLGRGLLHPQVGRSGVGSRLSLQVAQAVPDGQAGIVKAAWELAVAQIRSA